MKGTKPLLQIVNNLYLAHAPFEHSTTWHTCLFSCIRLFLDKLLKINSPCTLHMRCTVAFNNVMTECTYSYIKKGCSYSCSFCVRSVLGDLKVGQNAFA